jgi:hypothetical protein
VTTEERFERIEHLTAGIAEERRKDREEYKALWRETERHIDELVAGMGDLRRHVSELAVETRLRIQELADESRATERALRELGEATDARIAALVSAIGQHVRQGHPPQ